ncbi:hypothetical protein [Pelagibaculum spongiae]|uniref:Uncharacterized protein n=1 Tax=Pelagibaculum spongiae TaxID=2080658 RepID=A0A2V1GS35_9GAMM|nr:hypothetical protein [Pelagibaculum spongiae]PVZ64536.1 hypothetical protein DC094_19690 [Pelagibaculum spongiae]
MNSPLGKKSTEKEQLIVIGKYDPQTIPMPYQKTSLRRVIGISPKKIKQKPYIPIATDGEKILTEGCLIDAVSFFQTESKKRFMVLTNKEKCFLLQLSITYKKSIEVFESKYPGVFKVKYSKNLYRNLSTLKKNIAFFQREGVHFGLHRYLSTKNHFKISKKIRLKNSLDDLFFFLPCAPYQEVFCIEEKDPGRSVISLDFNSMYMSCMDEPMMHPGFLEFRQYDTSRVSIDDLPRGMFYVEFRKVKSNFFARYHPFKYQVRGESFPFKLDKENRIRILLLSDEIVYYSKYFESTHIFWGVVSTKLIQHPLLAESKKIYQKRTLYQSHGDDVSSSWCKIQLAAMHSATKSKSTRRLIFSTPSDLIDYVTSKYYVQSQSDWSCVKSIKHIDSIPGFRVRKLKQEWQLECPVLSDNINIFSLHAEVIARARLKMFKTLEQMASFPTVRVCYCNTDSIHLSVEKERMDAFFSSIAPMLSNEAGNLKVECISDQGLWLDIGRYWLKKNSEVLKFKNIIFNNGWSNNPYNDVRKSLKINKIDDYRYISEKYIHLKNSFSYKKKLRFLTFIDSYIFERYSCEEVIDPIVAGRTVANEIFNSQFIKLHYFKRLATS